MNYRRWLGAAVLVLGAVLLAFAVAGRREVPPAVPQERPALALLTSLPLIFGEEFGLQDGGSPALSRLEQVYTVEPIAVADASSLKGRQLLLMAHPRAQPAEALVELDQWVRDGGRVLLLADPMLSWESKRPAGDPLRPPPAFADTGLLKHWGLTLEGPRPDASIEVGGASIAAVSPGRLASRSCQLEGQGFVARCRIGKGKVTVIADADFLNGEPQELKLLLDELGRLENG